MHYNNILIIKKNKKMRILGEGSMIFKITNNLFITPDIGVSDSGPSVIRPYTSEQLRISGYNNLSGSSKNLKQNLNKLQ